jgi:hypothetical protein
VFCVNRPWGPPSLLYKGYWDIPGGKAAGAWWCPSTPTSAEVKERELYVYFLSGSSWPVLFCVFRIGGLSFVDLFVVLR